MCVGKLVFSNSPPFCFVLFYRFLPPSPPEIPFMYLATAWIYFPIFRNCQIISWLICLSKGGVFGDIDLFNQLVNSIPSFPIPVNGPGLLQGALCVYLSRVTHKQDDFWWFEKWTLRSPRELLFTLMPPKWSPGKSWETPHAPFFAICFPQTMESVGSNMVSAWHCLMDQTAKFYQDTIILMCV